MCPPVEVPITSQQVVVLTKYGRHWRVLGVPSILGRWISADPMPQPHCVLSRCTQAVRCFSHQPGQNNCRSRAVDLSICGEVGRLRETRHTRRCLSSSVLSHKGLCVAFVVQHFTTLHSPTLTRNTSHMCDCHLFFPSYFMFKDKGSQDRTLLCSMSKVVLFVVLTLVLFL